MIDTEQMRRELLEAGWIAERHWRWRAPDGGLYLGPYGAWKAMKGFLTEAEVLDAMILADRNPQ